MGVLAMSVAHQLPSMQQSDNWCVSDMRCSTRVLDESTQLLIELS
jgi:hypothetical protein